jgi:hypothetical protein
VARLEERAEVRELQEGIRSPAERRWDQAEQLASPEELKELERLEALSWTQEPESLELLDTMLALWDLKERMLRRVSPTLADIYRVKRDLPSYGLGRLREKAERDYEEWNPKDYASPEEAARGLNRLSERPYKLGTLQHWRECAVRDGLEPVDGEEEAWRMIEEVLEALDAGDTGRAERIVVTGELT